MREAISDEFDVESLLDTDAGLSFRRPGIGPESCASCGAVSGRPGSARPARAAPRRGARAARAVRARGAPRRAALRARDSRQGQRLARPQPVLKSRVQAWLVQKKDVIAFTQARASDGGTGALLVLLAPVTRLVQDRSRARTSLS